MLKTVCFTDNDLGKFFIFRIVKFSLQELRSASNPSERILNFMGEISQQAPSIFGQLIHMTLSRHLKGLICRHNLSQENIFVIWERMNGD